MTRVRAVLLLAAATPACAQAPAGNGTLTAINGIRVGHHTLAERPTGCTVILVDGDAVAGVSQRGAAPGTRDTDLLEPTNAAEGVNAVVLSGGSAYGLDAANGVMRWLDERQGWLARRTPSAGVPIVSSAVLIDLWVGGKPSVRPGADCGYRAARAASRAAVEEGSVGAGAGATVGKLTGLDHAMKGGLGSAAIALPSGLRIAAIVAVNALGDIIDPSTGDVVAGARGDDGGLVDVRTLLRSGAALQRTRVSENTTIAVVGTNARLTKADANRVALMADAGIARAVTPAHTTGDGDMVFALATGQWNGRADITVVGALAADVLAEAIVRAVKQATAVAGIPAARDLSTRRSPQP
jgi:L-aminopeptidase/D-esterase-like protein